MNKSKEPLSTLLDTGRVTVPIALNAEQHRAVTQWAADDRLWTTQENVAFNLEVFARVILAANR